MQDTLSQLSAVNVVNPSGMGRVVLICEHASNRIPDIFGDLGLNRADRDSHAAWDPGAYGLALRLSAALDAPLIASTVSRLVYDCNRPPDAADAMPAKSELIHVPVNAGLNAEQKSARVASVYDPFCAAVAQVLDGRDTGTIIVTVHSFTLIYFGKPRSVEIGLLHDDDSRLVDAMLDQTHALAHRNIQRNEPYGPKDGVTHTLTKHALPRGLANVMLEVRNDLLGDDDAIAAITKEILTLLTPAIQKLSTMEHQQ
jgi:predicted N-formylglutamate amidohydrolase